MASGDTKTQQYLDVAANGKRADLPKDNCCNTRTQNLIVGVAERIMDVEDEVEEMKNNPDVVDIVATYADLQAYDTSKLTDKDVIRVLTDSTHDDESTYYRYSKQTGQFTYIGTSKQYTDFVGTDGTTAGVNGLVPAPATTDAGKFLKSDGTWDTAGGGGGVTPVQTTGTSTTDVMSQDATTKMIYPDIANYPYKMVIGEGSIDGTNKGLVINGAINPGLNSNSVAIGATDGSTARIGQNGKASAGVAIGADASVGRGNDSVSIGFNAYCNSGQDTGDNVAIGHNSYAGNNNVTGTVALGARSKPTRQGEVNVGNTANQGYNNTAYRVIGGVHDGQDAHDCATVGQINATIDAINTALSTSIPHIGA